MEAANHHGQQQQFPPLPASPTLTNPDMILPDYDCSRSPDPDLGGRDHSPLMMWKNAHAAASAGDLQQMFAMTTPGQQMLDHPYGPTGPITPTTPIIYGNGTMLSDIGEVTEVESTPGRPSPTRSRETLRGADSAACRNGSDGGRASPTRAMEAMFRKRSKQNLAAQRERRSSMESTSTVTTQDQAALFADFDDSVSVGDSVFQGDDEESLASSYVDEQAPARETSRLGIPKTDSLERLSTYSTTSLSRRAEEILANAKKRLTTMEGNLTRARSTLYVTASASMSSLGSGNSTPSPPFQRASTAMYSRDSSTSMSNYSPGHSRMSSDIAMRNGLPYRVSTQRSQSVLGAAGDYRPRLTSSRSVDQMRIQAESGHGRSTCGPGIRRDGGLEPLSEDDAMPGREPNDLAEGAKLSQFLSPTFGTFQVPDHESAGTRGLTRSASATQMRDLKDQMKGLKGKISSLREQARVDSIKRRSLQSLRTPSPFTHSRVDQWYAEPKPDEKAESGGADDPSGRNPWNGEESSVDGDGHETRRITYDTLVEDDESVYSEVAHGTRLTPADGPFSPIVATDEEHAAPRDARDDISDVMTEDGDLDEDVSAGFQDVVDLGYDTESGESLYHDTLQHQISHEDREDAFDYEHFFLHSAMGTISQQRLGRGGSRDSFSSEDSVETTRGPIMDEANFSGREEGNARGSRSRARRNSNVSISTVETFATADEGRASRSGSSEGVKGARYPDDGDDGDSDESASLTAAEYSAVFVAASSTPASVAGQQMAYTGRHSDESIPSIPEEEHESQDLASNARIGFRISLIRRPMSSLATASLHRPSVSSFESTGTTRSFPLVSQARKANSTGVITPNSSPDQELRSISDTLLNETASICEREQLGAHADSRDPRHHQNSGSLSSTSSICAPSGLAGNPEAPPAMQALLREDQFLVERLVASLGRCVLGLTESGRASAESRMYRRRIDLARRILEGLEPVS